MFISDLSAEQDLPLVPASNEQILSSFNPTLQYFISTCNHDVLLILSWKKSVHYMTPSSLISGYGLLHLWELVYATENYQAELSLNFEFSPKFELVSQKF